MKLFNKREKQKDKIADEVDQKIEERMPNQQLMKLRQQSESPELEKKARSLEQKKINYKNKADCLDYVSEQCDMIKMAERQLMETKIEYGAVSDYLTDIQKIDRIQDEDKANLMDCARRILTLTKERSRFQNREVKISDIMYKHLEKYEDNIPSEIVKMKENEEYETLIKQDMQNLEGEKAVLTYEKEELAQKKSYIRAISIASCLIIVILFVSFGVLQSRFEVDLTLPTLLTVMMGSFFVLFLFLENNRTNTAMRLNERKVNKAIGLTNKIKIKFVNNRNNLDYSYQKYRVHAAKELEYLWEEYVKLKDETRRYQQNTELLEYYRKTLVEQLVQYDVDDAEVWLYQPLALIDGKEMVEVRHRLNTRRQKLREQIDYNNQILRTSRAEIQKVMDQVPELNEQIIKVITESEIHW